MKLVNQYQFSHDAESIALKLRRSGILARVSDSYSNTHSFASGAFKVGLWVILDEQYDDALSVLSDENYEVINPLTEEQMNKIEEVGFDESTRFFVNIFNSITAGLMICFILGFVFFVIYKLGNL